MDQQGIERIARDSGFAPGDLACQSAAPVPRQLFRLRSATEAVSFVTTRLRTGTAANRCVGSAR